MSNAANGAVKTRPRKPARQRKAASKPHPVATAFSVITLLLVLGFFSEAALAIWQGDTLTLLAQRLGLTAATLPLNP